MPGANLKSVGTIRDARKWPGRDGRKDPDKLDMINYNLLSPYTIQKMLNGIEILKNLRKVSGENSDAYTYQSGKIKSSSLKNGLKYYGMALDKFLGNSLITRIMNSEFSDIDGLRKAFEPRSAYGEGDWVDISGMIAPKKAVSDLLDDIQSGILTDVDEINVRFAYIHSEYYNYEWRWAYRNIREYYGVDLAVVTVEKLSELVSKWKKSVVDLDNMIYEDARKEFSLNAMTSFGADGDEAQRKEDFMQVRGSFFEADPFVMSVKEHIRVKSEMGDRVLEILHRL